MKIVFESNHIEFEWFFFCYFLVLHLRSCNQKQISFYFIDQNALSHWPTVLLLYFILWFCRFIRRLCHTFLYNLDLLFVAICRRLWRSFRFGNNFFFRLFPKKKNVFVVAVFITAAFLSILRRHLILFIAFLFVFETEQKKNENVCACVRFASSNRRPKKNYVKMNSTYHFLKFSVYFHYDGE